MASNGYGLDFKMFLEGVEAPFISASIGSTPGGTEASINIYSNKLAHDLLPKTSVQVFFKEWLPSKKGAWRLMFDGYISKVMESETATDGRMMSIIARDSIADLNKMPAAIVWDRLGSLKTYNSFDFAGVKHNIVSKSGDSERRHSVRTYNQAGDSTLISLAAVIKYVAGAAQGGGRIRGDEESTYNGEFYPTYNFKNGKSDGGLFLDAFARGIWSEAVTGARSASFMNKRIRVDKKLFIPKNTAGYRLWTKQSSSAQISGTLMGNSKFSSIAAAIMRVSGVFSTRMFSCSTPSAIRVDKDSPAVPYTMDEKVRQFMVDDNESEFGGKYVLNQMMLLPPLEFTAPPECNILYPPLYESISWTHDYDVDITRGSYKQADLFGGASGELSAENITIPNSLFSGLSTDGNGNKKLPLTLEERYKGVNPDYGDVAYKLGMDDAVSVFVNNGLNEDAKVDLLNRIAELEGSLAAAETNIEVESDLPGSAAISDLKSRLEAKRSAYRRNSFVGSMRVNAVKRHALIRFLNKKYSGRVLQVGMQFNPYLMAGFPTLIVSAEKSGDRVEMKDITGQIQQIQHDIMITPSGASATTSVVVNGARFVDEPTDMDKNGNPLYSAATNKTLAKVNPETYEYESSYFVGDSKSRIGDKERSYKMGVRTSSVLTSTVVREANAEELRESLEYSNARREYQMGLLNIDQTTDSKLDRIGGDIPLVIAPALLDNALKGRTVTEYNEYTSSLADSVKTASSEEASTLREQYGNLELEDPLALSDEDKEEVEKDFQERYDNAGGFITVDKPYVNHASNPNIGVRSAMDEMYAPNFANTETMGYNSIYNGEEFATPELAAKDAVKAYYSVDDVNPTREYVNPVVDRTYKEVSVPVRIYEDSPYDLAEVIDNDYKYAKDFLTRTSEDEANGEVNLQFLDDDYSPNKIHKFYRDTFGMEDSFMLGTSGDGSLFAYDTIHEASEALHATRSSALKDYESALTLCHRNICSADEFFGGVMGASKIVDGSYVVANTPESIDHSDIRSAYFGITTSAYEDINPKLKSDNGGLMEGPGSLSSITENIPLTPFISERRQFAERYIRSIKESSNYGG